MGKYLGQKQKPWTISAYLFITITIIIIILVQPFNRLGILQSLLPEVACP